MDCSGEHYSLCVAKWIGLPWCPGCGIGHAIHETFHGNWSQSFQYHPLGIPAVLILFYRITVLTRLQIASINSYIAFNKKPI
ncbi:hypothetical protein COR50_04470 [Chitinophaga caeni]|uniref:DUF2752 domain-containing protein n=2 Tax=Chitinophaga caeni TaxID=2029983 RepID=A0A291R0K2_9BACT|nr:hypothetical protein COR50_04470 [Chitinophaga caeni]